eukprot:15439834-Alexandrium_andersonii.AAC.1
MSAWAAQAGRSVVSRVCWCLPCGCTQSRAWLGCTQISAGMHAELGWEAHVGLSATSLHNCMGAAASPRCKVKSW